MKEEKKKGNNIMEEVDIGRKILQMIRNICRFL
jgi:hypothetical protein